MSEQFRSWKLPHDSEIKELIENYDRLAEMAKNEPRVTWWQRFWWWMKDFPR